VRDAETSGGHRFEAVVTDGLAARLALAVGAIVEPTERAIDVGQLGLDLLENREVLSRSKVSEATSAEC